MSLRGLLFRSALPVLVVSLLLVTGWSGMITWFGAHQGGIMWAAASSRSCRAMLEYWQQGWARRAALVAHESKEALVRDLAETEAAAIVSKDGRLELAARLSASFSRAARRGRFVATGFYLVDDVLVYVNAIPYAKGSPGSRLVLVRTLAEERFLRPLHAVSQNEVVMLEGAKAIDGTIRDVAGTKVFPRLEPGFFKALAQAGRKEFVQDKVTVEVPEYGGFEMAKSREVHRGESLFKAYVSFFRIPMVEASDVWLGVLVPEDAVLHGPRKAIRGSLVLLLLLSAVASAVLARLARRLMQPLSVATGQVDLLTKRLSESLSLSHESIRVGESGSGGEATEIAELRKSIAILDLAFNKTEQMRRSLDHERARAFAVSKLAALGEMAGGIAHEINSPLAAVSVLSGQMQDLLAEGVPDSVLLKEMAREVEATSMRIAKIVAGLRAFSRDGSQDPFLPVCVRTIVDSTVAFCSEKFRQHDVQLIVGEIPEVSASCRAAQISQVILNLLNNAYDAVEGRPGGWVELTVEERGERIEFSVKDSGKGIPAEIRDKLFEPFFTTKQIGKGTGLGLGISKRLVESHGGTLSVDVLCQNTRFVFVLPRAEPRRMEAA